MPSITTWTRLEPRTRSADPGPGLEARVFDPLWLLARQWQLGEFAGEDGGSPVTARVRTTTGRIARYRAEPDGRRERYDATLPLDPLIEREGAELDLRRRAQLGRDLVRALRATGLDREAARYAEKAPFETDASEAAGFLAIVNGATPDASRARELVEADLASARPAVRAVLGPWLNAYDAEVELARGRRAWDPERQEHRYSVQAAGAPVLTSPGRRGEPLDWYSFDAEHAASLGAGSSGTRTTVEAVPRGARYQGMPAARFWQFEDASVSFGDVDVAPEDLGRMLLIEFALVGADDWLVIPLPTEVGAVQAVSSLDVVDTFGHVAPIEPVDEGVADGPRWRMYRLSANGGDPLPLFLVTPSAGVEQVGEPVEDLRYVRDESANLGWAVERLVEDALGRPVDPYPDGAPPAARQVRAGVAYRVQSEVPVGWTPLVPVEPEPGVMELARGRWPGEDTHRPPASRVLAELERLKEEELPREGLAVERRWHYARWIDGSAHVWVARDVRSGAGEPESGLAFDRLE